MKKKITTWALLLAALTIAMPASGAYAARFTDVKESHWAYDAIAELSEKHLISGYPDGTFKPNRPVSLPEVLVLIKRIKAPADEAVKQAVANYGDMARASGAGEWATDSIAYALDRGIITQKQLEEAKACGKLKANDMAFPSRKEVAAYYARALNLSATKDHANLKMKDLDKMGTVFDEKDVEIPVADYVAALVKEDIFSAEGSDGLFQGDRPIRRSEMAKISKKTAAYAVPAQKAEDVVMYTKEGCKYCVMAKAMLRDSLHLSFVEKDISKDPVALREFKEKGYKYVPVIITDGKVVVGYKPDEITALFDTDKK